MDKESSNLDEELLKEKTSDKRIISFIPAGLASYLQPLDVSINELFKGVLREEYVNYCISNDTENIKVS